MAQPILVRGWSSTIGTNVCRGMLLPMPLAAAYLIFVEGLMAAGIGLAVAVFVIAAINEALAWWNALRRQWVTDTGSGLVVTNVRGELACLDSEVTDVLLDLREQYSEGLLKAVQRRLVLWVDGRPEPIEIRTRFRADREDPLEPVIGRIVGDLRERCRQRIRQGGRLEGDGWSLDRQSLQIAPACLVPLAEIASVGVFTGWLCVWKRGQDLPAAKVLPAGRNVPILYEFLLQCVEANQRRGPAEAPAQRQGVPTQRQPAAVLDEATESATGDLGRVLFERRSSVFQWTIIICGVVGSLGCGAMLLHPDSRPAGQALLLLPVILLLMGLKVPPSRIACCERGIRSSSLTGHRQMLYEEVEQFTYQAVRWFYNAVYTGTWFNLKFESPGTTIVYEVRLKNQDSDLEALRDRVSRVIAARMQRELAAGMPVRWTPNLTFQTDGILYRPFFTLGSPKVLSYDQIRGFNIKEGRFHLYAGDAGRQAIDEPVSAPNFFPGFVLLTTLLKQRLPDSGTLTEESRD